MHTGPAGHSNIELTEKCKGNFKMGYYDPHYDVLRVCRCHFSASHIQPEGLRDTATHFLDPNIADAIAIVESRPESAA